MANIKNPNFSVGKDFIVEQNPDPINGYRKWDSGLLEYWQRVETSAPANNYKSIEFAHPFSVPFDGGHAVVTVRTNTGGSWLNIELKRALVKQTGVDIGFNNLGGASTVQFQIICHTRWK